MLNEKEPSEIWNLERTVCVRRLVFDDFLKDHPYLKGGQYLREAALAIAKDMLANKAVKVDQTHLYDEDKLLLTYVVRCGTPNNYRILPK